MATPRSNIVDPDNPGVYHCVSRCVRGAFLLASEGDDCGSGAGIGTATLGNRRARLQERTYFLARVFAIDVASYGILDNHMHHVLCTHPERVAEWSDVEVVTRWNMVFPKSIQTWALEGVRRDRKLSDAHRSQIQHGRLPEELAITIVAGLGSRVQTLRTRISSLSWFMRCLKHEFALEANREDGARGHFWEGRFKSTRVLDLEGLVHVMIYVDLNMVRATLALTPETSDYSSVQDRIEVMAGNGRGTKRKKKKRRRRSGAFSPVAIGGHHGLDRTLDHPDLMEDGDADRACWLAPIRELLGITTKQYLKLLDAVGRQALAGKRGRITNDLAPILERLGLDEQTLATAGNLNVHAHAPRGTVAGSPASCAREAARRGVRFVLNALRGDRS